MTTVTPPPASITTTFAELEAKRRLQKDYPYLGNFFATIYMAMTTVILAYAGIFGAAAIVLLYAIWLSKILFKGKFLLSPSADLLMVLLLPSLAVASAAWSDYPQITVKSALEYTSLAVCVFIMAKIVRTHVFMRGIIIGSTGALLASLASNKYGVDPMTGKSTLIGLFDSKNMIGFFAEIGLLLSILNYFIRQHFISRILYTLIPICVCAVSLYMSKSATSLLSLLIVLAAIAAAYFITKFPRSFRLVCVIAGGSLLFMVGVAATVYGLQNTILKSFDKDPTLTGRTYLWSEGIQAGMETPFLGHGYAAFWVAGRPKAEQLWNKFGIPAKIGFHFHNTFIETFVELGSAGLALIAFILIWACFKSIGLVMRHGMSIEYVLPFSVTVLFLCRAMVEVDLIGTFNMGPVLFYAMIPKMADSARARNPVTP